MPEENVKVAVRVRPFNGRERARNAVCIVEMNGPTTIIKDPESEEEKKFAFDFSYWSFDGSKDDGTGFYGADASHPNGRKFADQRKVYDDLGVGILKNAWEGFNSTLFAYGQTGSGKSWSIVGYGVNKGVVPQFCDNIFKSIDEKRASGDATEYEVIFSMLEIYNENVHDLLDASGGKQKVLKVRQHPKNGFYAENLKIVPVVDYKDIEHRMDEGTKNRTVAATNMNATSSRAHTIVGITFVQKFQNAAGEDTTKQANINLVDLAGSERAESTGATGDRLKEGAAINQSLSSLGNVISALADKSNGKNVKVPFRDSCLTKLLKNALSGNSKTIMIAAVSPADINFEESLGTLRYADRAKQIKTKATVNEDPTDKLIRELQEENEKLKAMLGGDVKMEVMKDDDEDLSDEEMAKLKAEMQSDFEARLADNDKEMEEMKKTFEEKLASAGGNTGGAADETREMKKKIAHMYNLNMDPQLTGYIINFFDTPSEKIGNGKDEGETELVLVGAGIAPRHAIVKMEGDQGKFTLEPGSPDVRMMVNGKPVVEPIELKHNDRVLFGTTQYFCFCHPKQRDASKEKFPDVTFEMAQQEIAQESGFNMENTGKDDALLQEDIVELMPAVENANSISEDLDKKMKFELMVVSPEARGELTGRNMVMVRVINLETKHEWVWPREKFLNRKFVMQEMHTNFMEGEDWDMPKEKDPFDEDYTTEFHIGSVKCWMQSMAYMIESKEQLSITDYRGEDVGLVNIEAIPCDGKGKEYGEKDDVFVEDPNKLLEFPLNFVFKLLNARGLPNRFTDVYAKYLVYKEEDFTATKPIPNTTNPDWNHSRVLKYPKADSELLKFLKDSAIMIQIWGKQKAPKERKTINTKMSNLAAKKGGVAKANDNVKRFDGEKVKLMMTCNMLTKKSEKQEAKLRHMREMIEIAQEHKKKRITVGLINDIYIAKTEDNAQKCIALVPLEKDEDTDDECNNPGNGEMKEQIAEMKVFMKTEKKGRKEKRRQRRVKRTERRTKRQVKKIKKAEKPEHLVVVKKDPKKVEALKKKKSEERKAREQRQKERQERRETRLTKKTEKVEKKAVKKAVKKEEPKVVITEEEKEEGKEEDKKRKPKSKDSDSSSSSSSSSSDSSSSSSSDSDHSSDSDSSSSSDDDKKKDKKDDKKENKDDKKEKRVAQSAKSSKSSKSDKKSSSCILL